jgi:molecular chaperone HscB
MNLQSTDFELFDVPARFAQDTVLLDGRWKDLQRQVHPDRFAAQGAAAQRVAMQWSARINEAYRRLKDPLQRAAYLCELHDAPIDAERNTAMPTEFLMEQMTLREALDDARGTQDLDELGQTSAAMQRELLTKIERQIDGEHGWADAAGSVRALMFLDRLSGEVARKRAALAAVADK